jgi:hypothetical protein
MLLHMINPDLIQDGDQVTIQDRAGTATTWTVRRHMGRSLQLMTDVDIKNVPLSGRRTPYQIVGHQPRLV